MEKPMIDEIRDDLCARGMPRAIAEHEAEKLWNFYESKADLKTGDWKVGKTKMTRWRNASAGWFLRWKERACIEPKPRPPNDDELNEILRRGWTLDRIRQYCRARHIVLSKTLESVLASRAT